MNMHHLTMMVNARTDQRTVPTHGLGFAVVAHHFPWNADSVMVLGCAHASTMSNHV
jgi:hypothetical protein